MYDFRIYFQIKFYIFRFLKTQGFVTKKVNVTSPIITLKIKNMS